MSTEFNYRKVKSDTHCAAIDSAEHPVSENLQRVFYKGRWRLIQVDDAGCTFVEYPGAIVYFNVTLKGGKDNE